MFRHLVVTAIMSAPCIANAGQSVDVSGTMACVNDKWNESEPEKGHKVVEYSGRCVVVPNDLNAKKYVENCAGSYEYLPDGTWKGSGNCTSDLSGGDTFSLTWGEGSALQEYVYSYTGGTGKYKGAKGGGTYKTEELTPTLYAGRKRGKLELP